VRKPRWLAGALLALAFLYAPSALAGMATRAPTGDEALTGTWTCCGARYNLAADYPDTTPNSVLTGGTATGTITFGFSAFAIPAGSTSISVQVNYHDRHASGTSAVAGQLKINA
jgi:hypothetical protein